MCFPPLPVGALIKNLCSEEARLFGGARIGGGVVNRIITVLQFKVSCHSISSINLPVYKHSFEVLDLSPDTQIYGTEIRAVKVAISLF